MKFHQTRKIAGDGFSNNYWFLQLQTIRGISLSILESIQRLSTSQLVKTEKPIYSCSKQMLINCSKRSAFARGLETFNHQHKCSIKIYASGAWNVSSFANRELFRKMHSDCLSMAILIFDNLHESSWSEKSFSAPETFPTPWTNL